MRITCLVLASCLPIIAQEPVPAEKAAPDTSKEAAYPALERFVKVMEMARERHPDLDRLSYDQLINQALDGMLSSLDRHSSFIHPEMNSLISEEGTLENEIKSLGLSIGKDSENLYISAVEKGGSADLAKLSPEMKIIKINKQDASNLPLRNALDLLIGKTGEAVNLVLLNPKRPGEIEVSLTHRFIEERSLVVSNLLAGHPEIGYLRLAQFGPNCAREVEAALDDLEDKGMKSLIIDLRGNGGGDLHQTVSLLGFLVPPNTMVVSVRERDKPEELLKTPQRQRRKRDYPIAVLIDQNSASASELTAGALSDLKRATIIGEVSYGKGSVQNIIPMGNGTALRLTIATYHTPSGNTPHLRGITPEILINFSKADRENFIKSGHASSLTPEEKKSLDAWKDPAISAAVSELSK